MQSDHRGVPLGVHTVHQVMIYITASPVSRVSGPCFRSCDIPFLIRGVDCLLVWTYAHVPASMCWYVVGLPILYTLLAVTQSQGSLACLAKLWDRNASHPLTSVSQNWAHLQSVLIKERSKDRFYVRLEQGEQRLVMLICIHEHWKNLGFWQSCDHCSQIYKLPINTVWMSSPCCKPPTLQVLMYQGVHIVTCI